MRATLLQTVRCHRRRSKANPHRCGLRRWWLVLILRCVLTACFVNMSTTWAYGLSERRNRSRLVLATHPVLWSPSCFLIFLVGGFCVLGVVSSASSVTISRTVPNAFYRSDSWFEATRVTVIISCLSMFLQYLLFPVQLLCSWWSVGEASIEPCCTGSLLAKAIVAGFTAVMASSYSTERMPWLVQISLLTSGYHFLAAVGLFVRFRVVHVFRRPLGRQATTVA